MHILPALGKRQLSKLTPQHVQSFLNEKAKASSPRIVKYCRDVLRIALNQAVRWQLLAVNAAALTVPPHIERKEVDALSREDACAILNAFRGQALEMPVTLALTLGLRRGEILGLRWPDIDLERATLSTIMEILGHSQISTTMNIYAHVGAELLQDVADKMQMALGGD